MIIKKRREGGEEADGFLSPFSSIMIINKSSGYIRLEEI